MTEAFTPIDDALVAVLEACREQLLAAAWPAVDSAFDDLLASGHSVQVVSTALIGACSQLLFEAIFSNVEQCHQITVAEDATARLIAHLRTTSMIERGDAVPAGVTVQ